MPAPSTSPSVVVVDRGRTVAGVGPSSSAADDLPATETARARVRRLVLPAGYTGTSPTSPIAVPEQWTDDGRPTGQCDGSTVPQSNVATDVDVWRATFDPAGSFYARTSSKARPHVPRDTTQTFDNGTYIGLMQTWSNCGDSGAARLVMLAVSPPDKSVTLYLEIQLPTDDNTALQTILSSFAQL